MDTMREMRDETLAGPWRQARMRSSSLEEECSLADKSFSLRWIPRAGR